MRFCPVCGGVMVPVKRKDKTIVLKCTKCGYEMEIDAKSSKEYAATTRAGQKVLTTKVVSKEVKVNMEENKEELEQAKEDYYELVLDEMGEYGEQSSP
ncbi:MAG: transcription elongation factor [Acidilobus sp.]